MQYFPAILTGSFQEAQHQLNMVQEAELPTLQFDVIDGMFADNITLTPCDYVQLELGSLTLDIHLMTQEPLDFVHECIDNKRALPIRAIIAQVERMSSQTYYIEEVRAQQWKVGLSLDLDTPLEAIDDNSWVQLDVIQLMSVRAGFQGQTFEQFVMQKLAELEDFLQQHGYTPEVILDGGIGLEHLAQLRHIPTITGVVMGSAIWKSSDPVVTMKELVTP